ncbi:hypothetical protein LUZ61_003759 [Rhynchospora tenuis]|uniref:F-box domain-containing protein n=1 Tax=Rhynchospora tenuis TaxID=198213 RepID=A0AAD5ZLG5_9POAL|nr:hypothetical protein LUZ61_003759 [Rhynchospora tenuis]
MAARTSCLSRRFHRLWLASPSLHFDRNYFSITRRFVKMVNSVLLGRHRSPPLETLCIESSFRSRCPLPFYPVLCWIIRADDLGVRHLCLTLEADTVAVLFWVIFSIESLESLHIETLHFTNRQAALPVTIFSTCLKSLSLWFNVDSAYLTRLIRELPVLEYLELKHINQIRIDLSSMSVKKLKLQVHSCNIMKLCFPKLDFIHLICEVSNMEMFQGEMPLVSQAVLIMRCPYKVPTLVLESMLKSAANVVELTLSIETSVDFESIYLTCCEMQLSFPRLENFKFSCSMCFLKLFQAEMPVLRKANIQISYAKEEFAPPVSNFLKCIANVVDLKFTIRDNLVRPQYNYIYNYISSLSVFVRNCSCLSALKTQSKLGITK